MACDRSSKRGLQCQERVFETVERSARGNEAAGVCVQGIRESGIEDPCSGQHRCCLFLGNTVGLGRDQLFGVAGYGFIGGPSK